jgi:hypothetical protein
LIGVQKINIVVTIERLWASGSKDPDAAKAILLLSKDATD